MNNLCINELQEDQGDTLEALRERLNIITTTKPTALSFTDAFSKQQNKELFQAGSTESID